LLLFSVFSKWVGIEIHVRYIFLR